MNKKLQINEDKEQLKNVKYNDIMDKISTKSSNIKAMMKFKYLIYKLERGCSKKKFLLF